MSKSHHITLQADNFNVSYDSALALRALSFKVTGGVIGIVGQNGAGKSTLIRSILGLTPKTSGQLIVQNQQSQTPLLPETDMIFCPEIGSVFSDVVVSDYLKFWCRLKLRDPHYYLNEGKALLQQLDLEPLFSKRGRELSKGQKRRVQTAVAFLLDSKLLLFDEPFDGLDLEHSSELIQIIKQRSESQAFILSSHRMDILEELADSIIVLHSGQLIAAGEIPLVCTQLAGQSWQLRIRPTSFEGHDDMQDLKTAERILRPFQKSFVSRTPYGLRVTGRELSPEALALLAEEQGLALTSIEPCVPRLLDAMQAFTLNKNKTNK
jgi:ABC-2 type transport system ATP-binding protein